MCFYVFLRFLVDFDFTSIFKALKEIQFLFVLTSFDIFLPLGTT